jgi:hypothetical protein
MTMPSLEQSMPSKWVLWASQQDRSPQLAEVARKALCFHPFSESGLLEDVVTVWKIHDGAGCDADTTAGEVRSQIQKTFLSGLAVRELPPVDEAICIRAMTVVVNFATDGNTYKATGDRLIHDFIRCHLRVEDLAAIPSNQPPYAANARLDKAETIIKEVVPTTVCVRVGAHMARRQITEPALTETLSRFEPIVSCDPTLVLVLWTLFAELWKERRHARTPVYLSLFQAPRVYDGHSPARQNVQRRGVVVRGLAPCQ